MVKSGVVLAESPFWPAIDAMSPPWLRASANSPVAVAIFCKASSRSLFSSLFSSGERAKST